MAANGDVTILTDAADSSELVNPGWARSIELYAPGTLAETCTVLAAPAAGGTYRNLQNVNMANVTLAANAALIVDAPAAIKIHLGTNAAANRTFSYIWRNF